MKSKVLYAFVVPVVGSLLLSASSSLAGCGSGGNSAEPLGDGGKSDATAPPGDDDDDDDDDDASTNPDSGPGSADGSTDAGDGSTTSVPPPPFEYHHHPFVYFKNWGGSGGAVNDAGVVTPNGKWVQNHNVQDEQDFFTAATAGKLPAVAFVKPLYDEHPNYTTETDSENHTVRLLNAITSGPEWSSTVVIITYDENGGHADHVPPPTSDTIGDQWGPGTRVPGIVISPFAKGGVDSTVYDTTSILALIENRWSLPTLQTRDAAQADISANAMTFGSGSLQSAIQHVVVIYLENHSFDSLLGSWPGAEGLPANGGVPQVGPDGGVYPTLPEYGPYPSSVESLEDASVKNGVFDFTTYYQEGQLTNDLLHKFYQEQMQINGGKMDSYVLWNNESAGQSMGYWPTASLPMPQWMKAHAANVTVLDHFFHAAFGGSFLNHFWLIGARSPVYSNPPLDAGLVASPNEDGTLTGVPDTTSVPPGTVFTTLTDGNLTPPMLDFDGEKTINFVVNTSYSVNQPHPSSYDGPTPKSNPVALVPQQTWRTIGDLLDDASLSWCWYDGGWNATVIANGVPSLATSSGIGDAGP